MKEQVSQVSLMEIFLILKKRLVQILIWSLIGCALSAAYTFFLVTPMYQSMSKIVVNQTQNTNQTITNIDIQTNLSLINTYQSIIKEPIILEEVVKETDLDITPEELRNKITVETEANSLAFGVSVEDENPYTAAELANAVASKFEQKIGQILEVESVTILSTAIPDIYPVSPNVLLNLIVGLFIGMLGGIVYAIMRSMMDKTVKDAAFVESLGWTNLGNVFEMTQEEIVDSRIAKHRTLNQRPHMPKVHGQRI